MNSIPPNQRRERRALCVDDDFQLRPLVALILQSVGFAVIEAGSCAQGRQALESETPALVVLDVDLSDGNGFDLAEAWRREGHPLPPILFISGREPAECHIRAARLNAAFLPKPFDAPTLLAAVRALLAHGRQQGGAVTGSTG